MSAPRDSQGIQSVHTALRVLEALCESRKPMGVTEIANHMGETKTRIFRHLRTLLADGYVHQDTESEKYRLSIKLFHLGRAAEEQSDLLAEARRVMQTMCDRLNITVSLGRPVDKGVFIVDIVRADTPFEISTRPGYILPFNSTAQGKVVLAHATPDAVKEALARPLERLTPETITDPDVIRAQIQKARIRGWAVAPGETLPGLNALAAPIFDASGKLVATIAFIGTTQSLPKTTPPAMISSIIEAGRTISQALGYHELLKTAHI